MLKKYYILTKPGIIYGNALTVVAGFFLASSETIDYRLLMLTVIGVSLVVASGCVFNNYIDRDIDALMERTKSRPLVRGTIGEYEAKVFGFLLGGMGLVVLYCYTNILTVFVAMVGFVVYIFMYSLWLKRSSTHSILIGSISGAVPVLAGYVAVRGGIDMGAMIIFIMVALWQLPHSFAIALYRMSDYKNAHIPVLPLVRGVRMTKIQIALYIILFTGMSWLLFITGYVGNLYVVLMGGVLIIWTGIAIRGFFIHADTERMWARNVFLTSIVVIMVLCVTIVWERLFF